jgi:hypothetical protein
MTITLKAFEDLEKMVRNWTAFNLDQHIYDSAGIMTLFEAIIDNMRENFTDTELEDYCLNLEEEQKKFIKKLSNIIGVVNRH